MLSLRRLELLMSKSDVLRYSLVRVRKRVRVRVRVRVRFRVWFRVRVSVRVSANPCPYYVTYDRVALTEVVSADVQDDMQACQIPRMRKL